MYTTIEEANDAYYYKYTTESSKYNIEKMHQLLKSGETEDALRGTANGIISTHHLMYKADTLYSKDGRREYDFLIEYHIICSYTHHTLVVNANIVLSLHQEDLS